MFAFCTHVQFSMYSIVLWKCGNEALSIGQIVRLEWTKTASVRWWHPPPNIEIHVVLVGLRAHRPANGMSGAKMFCLVSLVLLAHPNNSCAINDRASLLPVKLSTADLENIWGPGYHWSAWWWSLVCYWMWTSPPPTSTSHPPDVIHVIGVLRLSPFFATFPLPCIILNANRKTKNGGGLGTRLLLFLIFWGAHN